MFLGVDGGGTKTALCLLGADGRDSHVLAELTAPSTYSMTDPVALVREVLGAAVPELCAAAGVGAGSIRHAFVGLPAYGEVVRLVPDLDAAVHEALAPWAGERVGIGNDMVCGWAGSLALADGVNVIAGTGSMAYGERAGRRARVGGWGELFGDEGSAHWIGLQGLGLFSRMSDGRAPTGPLHAALAEHLDLTDDLEVIDVVLGRWRGDRTRVAGLARVVAAAAGTGDEGALALLETAADHLVELVEAARSRLGFDADEPVPLSWSGGVFSAALVLTAFRSRLEQLPGAYELRPPRHSPVLGAALYAAHLAGSPLDPDRSPSAVLQRG